MNPTSRYPRPRAHRDRMPASSPMNAAEGTVPQ
ncbi:hypothetical protein SCANM63S_07239 [Streptomyces canarius]